MIPGRSLVVGLSIVACSAAGADFSCGAVYPDSPVEEAVCEKVGPVAPTYRDCLVRRKLRGNGFLERHALCLFDDWFRGHRGFRG